MESPARKRLSFVTLIAAVVGGVIGSTAVRHYFDQPASVDQALAMAAGQINKGLPVMVDKETRLDAATVGPDKTMVYQYTLVNISAANIQKDRLIGALRPTIVKNYQTNDSMKSFRDNGVTMEYRYSDKDGVFIAGFSVSPKDF